MSAWTPENEPASVAAGAVTLVDGSSFCLSASSGDIAGAGPLGVFFRDTRILSRWELTVDGEHPESLAALTPEPFHGTFVGRLSRKGGTTDTSVLVQRDRRVGDGIREDLRISNPGSDVLACTVELVVEADLAGLFEVKDGQVRPRADRAAQADGERLVLGPEGPGGQWGAVVEAPGSRVLGDTDARRGTGILRWDVEVPPRGEWSTSILVTPVVGGVQVETSFPLERPMSHSLQAQRLRGWQESTPLVTTAHVGLQHVLRRSQEDLGALRIFDRDDPSLAAVAAGAPWFMALFGRDSLLTAYMSLPLGPDLALGTLRTLAAHQGRRTDSVTEEEPGRILHEVRLGEGAGPSPGGAGTYYGTADATPLFVVLLGELASWGVDRQHVRDLLPHADRALEWVDRHGDRDGDGFVEYERTTDRGLRNQGWKDSWDGVTFADGRPAEPSIALCEVQGYVYAAFRARAALARDLDDAPSAQRWLERAAALKVAFNEQFWLPKRGWYALALDRDKSPVDACASNMGHCLWTGIVDEDKAASVVEHLLSPEMFTGWGIRTLASSMGAYDPVSYHNGSVWPHDNALIVAGLVRYGFVAQAQQVGEALLEAAQRFGGRLPELFCGFDRGDYPEPVPYPTSCSPQAWAAAAPVQLVRSLLRLEPRPELPQPLAVDPTLPSAYLPFSVEGIRVGERRFDLGVGADGVRLDELSEQSPGRPRRPPSR